jgi:hypothetical protein
MSLHNTVANKKRPCYYCKRSVRNNTKEIGGTICGDFNIGWEYSISYVENRVPKHLISIYFEKHLVN